MEDREYLISQSPWKALVAFSLPMMLGNLFQQLYTMTDSVIVGRYVGEDALDDMKEAVSTSLVAFLALSILMAAFGYLFSQDIMRALNTPADILDDAVLYLRIYFLGLPFLFMYNILSSTFNALGRSRIPLYFLVFSFLLSPVVGVAIVWYIVPVGWLLNWGISLTGYLRGVWKRAM